MAVSAKRVVSHILTTVILLSLVAGGLLAYLHRQQINDHFASQSFQASVEIVQLTDRLQLTEAGHRVFWASEPTLDSSQAFNERCSQVDHSEEGHVLGCYSSLNIHLFNVQDERLSGIVEVTAAHELLHAVFARLGDNERANLSKRLNTLYEELIPDDPELELRMSVYKNLSKIGFANELHSVLGTEQWELPEWLEVYYAEWFEDRTLILEYFDSYHEIFLELKNRADVLQTDMQSLRLDVEARSEAYDQAVNTFNAEWNAFIARNEAYEFSDDPDEFYRLRDAFYDRRDQLSTEMHALNDSIARYEEMRGELLELSELNHELERKLDSELAPPAPAPVSEL